MELKTRKELVDLIMEEAWEEFGTIQDALSLALSLAKETHCQLLSRVIDMQSKVLK